MWLPPRLRWLASLVSVAGALGAASPPAQAAPPAHLPSLLAIGDQGSTCVVRTIGVACWGLNDTGLIGNGYNVPATRPYLTLSGSDYAEVAVGARAACAVRTDTTGAPQCWGSDELGLLGDNPTSPQPGLFRLSPVSATQFAGYKTLAISDYNTCLLSVSATVSCVGDNVFRGLGNGATSSATATVPGPVSGLSGVTAIAGGHLALCAVRQAGTVACWGSGYAGELGAANPSGPTAAVPVEVANVTGAVDVAAGESHVCALRADGTVACWGQNFLGQLGDGATAAESTAVNVRALSDAVQVAVGDEFTCALRRSGSVVCWGANSAGQLGNGTVGLTTTPTPVSGLTDAVFVAAGGRNACAIRRTGGVVCWGNGDGGRLGSPPAHPAGENDATTPVPVPDITDARTIDSTTSTPGTSPGGATPPTTSTPGGATGGSTSPGTISRGTVSIRGAKVRIAGLLLARGATAACPKTVSVAIVVKTRTITRRLNTTRTPDGCRVSGRVPLPAGAARSATARVRITGTGLPRITRIARRGA